MSNECPVAALRARLVEAESLAEERHATRINRLEAQLAAEVSRANQHCADWQLGNADVMILRARLEDASAKLIALGSELDTEHRSRNQWRAQADRHQQQLREERTACEAARATNRSLHGEVVAIRAARDKFEAECIELRKELAAAREALQGVRQANSDREITRVTVTYSNGISEHVEPCDEDWSE